MKDFVQMAEKILLSCGKEEAKNDAELIFRYLMNVDKMGFFKLWGTELDDATGERYLDLVAKRAEGVPLQHITGTQEFMGLTFLVKPEVLIPRQDTEVLVNEVIQMVRDIKKSCKVLDLGCGTGAIGLSIARLCENAKVTLSDVSSKAIEAAKQNAKVMGLEKKVSFEQGYLFAPFEGRFRRDTFDIIVSNPPYIRSDVIPTLQVEVREHEPILALDGGKDGLDFYRAILEKAQKYLTKTGVLAFEIGNDQALAVAQIAKELHKFNECKFVKDLAGNDRVLIFS